MGDIAFLVLIFFILCSEAIVEKPIGNLELATSSEIEQLKQRGAIFVAIDAEGTTHLSMGYGKATVVQDPATIKWAVRSRIDQIKQADRTLNEKDKLVLFKCHRDLDQTAYQPAIDAITEGGGVILNVGIKTN